ncbi:cytochrome c peroxidase : Cytochrome c peroxidase OS=Singulisphaera acidiphila (strain ATCC BAA-1392 / DSM 18658 / VKM B-2454 / MOB10) GN=Sinac_5068 PE=4 SV=1: CCP_MauG [Gemmata massiliana]|uniref:Cytochrome c domain-containing protein n=1 Tax=Gemmata massiliana TaxID=1210884 RepID=A0A6P2CR55_9BACT|nr:cytochrome c peroxidase [Gemmata massiliana]VTR91369.1 cytochrome c peroxidase : Cytochrome c peroxidase OS=Singulisphaera acidiphila (strain ATCC BAA-1392 / DSM 18658 / VKM B-2454 / MOB10) GN=Sinac_5068 PE=4 SV=1: CCP_MauG [Gemmata massiliana]
MTVRWVLFVFALLASTAPATAAQPPLEAADFLLPNESKMTPFKDRVPVVFVTSNQPEWKTLKGFWTEGTQEDADPASGQKVTRKVVKLKVPLGLTQAPVVPAENAMTVEKWVLGKQLYYDKIMSTNGSVACATCHAPTRGFSDGKRTSTGINDALGPINSPTVFNSAYNRFQFWDGRGSSLEDQAQGPVGNNKEMFGGKADPWEEAVARLRANAGYVKAFNAVFGHAPTRDAAAKAIATYERTVLLGNSLHDKAEAAMRKRVIEEESGKFVLKSEDYASALKDEFAAKGTALKDLGLDAATDAGKADELGKRLLAGRDLFFNKARCTNCHTGDTYTDHGFHNLGIGAKDGELPLDEFGRFVRLPTGHKDTALVGAFKTPGTRGLLWTSPYMHSGDEKTLEQVVDFYDRGGNVNAWLSEKMRDTAAESAYIKARAEGKPVDPAVKTYGPTKKPIIPLKLNLTAQEKADLVLFLRALNGDPLDPIVADPEKFPGK